MNPIEELKQEHEGIKVSLNILSRIVGQLGKNEEAEDVEALERLVEFFTVFVDTCHHGKEEELLFPALEGVGVSREGGPIAVMLVEHEMGRAHVRAIRGALADYKAGNGSLGPEIQRQADGFAKLLHLHIEKENQVLFRIAEEHLSEAVKNDLEEGFEKIETNRVGPGKHEMFHRMLEELQKKYCG